MAPGLTTYAVPLIQSWIKIKLSVTRHQIGKWVTDWRSSAPSFQSEREWPHLPSRCLYFFVLFVIWKESHLTNHTFQTLRSGLPDSCYLQVLQKHILTSKPQIQGCTGELRE